MHYNQFSKNMSSILVFEVIILILCCNSTFSTEPLDWWELSTIYQIYPLSFMDSNDDGNGDLNGITSRLEYLKEIGITAAWLSPIFQSPMKDMGYDVSNFTNIDPKFGTLSDFDAMIAKAHKLGIKIALDIVPNHSSNECEWFQKSILREDGYDDFYVWADGRIDEKTGNRVPPNNWQSIFGGSAWSWNEKRQQYYHHIFLQEQPDFNWRNPKVHEIFFEIFDFWLKRGVDAFRMDALPYLYEKRYENGTFPDNPDDQPLLYIKDQPENLLLMYEWREYLDKYKEMYGGDTRIMIGEAYSPIEILSDSINNGTHKGIQMPMNFKLTDANRETDAKQMVTFIDYWIHSIWAKHKVANWVVSNHDKPRVATLVGQNKADMFMMISHALPGLSITYYGEEIGMSNLEIKNTDNSRDDERTPMQWDNTKNAGFSKANRTWLPVNPNYKYINVKVERGSSLSSLNIFKGMVNLKKTAAFKAFKEDGAFSYSALNDNVLHIMRTDRDTEEYRLLANLNNRLEFVEGLTNKTMKYVLLNSYSAHKYNDEVDLSKVIYLQPFESVILHWKETAASLV